jgi:hypothetical protein
MFSPQEKQYVEDMDLGPGSIGMTCAYLTLCFRADVRGSASRAPVLPEEVYDYLHKRTRALRLANGEYPGRE